MPKKPVIPFPVEVTAEPSVTQLDVVAAVTNDPALAETFMLGDRAIPIVDLEYSDYLIFVSKLMPLMKVVMGAVSSQLGLGNLQLPTADLDPEMLLSYCIEDLPYLACIVCNQSDKDITVADVKRLGKTPFKLASLVLAQVKKNEMVSELSSFIRLLMPTLKLGQAQK